MRGLLVLVLIAGLTAGHGTTAAASESAEALRDRLIAAAPVGSSAYVDPATGEVVLRVVGTRRLAGATTDRRVRVSYGAAPIRPMAKLYGGSSMQSLGGRGCTTGFTASPNGNNPPYYLLTAGHCLSGTDGPWFSQGALIGSTWDYTWPGDDHGIIRRSDVSPWQPTSLVLYGTAARRITGVGNPVIGLNVCKTGVTTGTTCGPLTAVNVTVNYHDGPVTGLIEVAACAAAGDSGGPLFQFHAADPNRMRALGVVSGGTAGPCTTASRSYHQPVSDMLIEYHLGLVGLA